MDCKNKTQLKNYAIILGNGHFNSLGLARSLGENGVPVFFINRSDCSGAESSKYVINTYHAKEHNETIDIIDNIISTYGGKPVLFPCSDDDALFIDNFYKKLNNKTFSPGSMGKIEYFMNKENMCSIAKNAGFNVPETISVNVDKLGKETIRKFKLPFIIKPLKSIDGIKTDITICFNKEDTDRAIAKFFDKDSIYKKLLIQTFLTGETNRDFDISGYKIRGQKAKLFAQIEKIRSFPDASGSTTFCIVKPKITTVDIDVVDRLLEEMNFEGIFDLDIKEIDSVPYFIEINLRNGAVSYGYTVAGFNIPYSFYLEKTKGSIPSSNINIKETVIMCERDDLNHVLIKKISPIKWLKDIRKTNAMMLFNKKDRKPFQKCYGKLVDFVFGIIASKSV